MACNVLLVAAPKIRDISLQADKGYIPPLSLGYLAAALERAKYDVEIVDMEAHRLRGADLARLVQEKQPRVVGITTMVVSYKNGLRAAEVVKQASPSTRVMMGGPQATFLVKETLACPAVDVVVRFEGEETVVELMRHFDGEGAPLEQIRGVAFREGEGIHQTEPRPLITDLDSLPLPARHLFKFPFYSQPGVMITARGCPSQCVFCAANTLYPDIRYRTRSPQLVVDEMVEMVERFGQHDIFIADDTFTLQPKRAIEICDLLIARGLEIKWTCEARVNTMTPELVHKMRAAGCYGVQYGVETGNPEIMKLIRKGIHLEQVEEVVNYSQAAGLDVVCSFIIGFPWDTRQTVAQTIQFAHKLRQMGADHLNMDGPGRGMVKTLFSYLTPLPGTYVYDHADELGIRFLSRDWDRYSMYSPVIETRCLSSTDIRDLYVELVRAVNLKSWHEPQGGNL